MLGEVIGASIFFVVSYGGVWLLTSDRFLEWIAEDTPVLITEGEEGEYCNPQWHYGDESKGVGMAGVKFKRQGAGYISDWVPVEGHTLHFKRYTLFVSVWNAGNTCSINVDMEEEYKSPSKYAFC